MLKLKKFFHSFIKVKRKFKQLSDIIDLVHTDDKEAFQKCFASCYTEAKQSSIRMKLNSNEFSLFELFFSFRPNVVFIAAMNFGKEIEDSTQFVEN